MSTIEALQQRIQELEGLLEERTVALVGAIEQRDDLQRARLSDSAFAAEIVRLQARDADASKLEADAAVWARTNQKLADTNARLAIEKQLLQARVRNQRRALRQLNRSLRQASMFVQLQAQRIVIERLRRSSGEGAGPHEPAAEGTATPSPAFPTEGGPSPESSDG